MKVIKRGSAQQANARTCTAKRRESEQPSNSYPEYDYRARERKQKMAVV